MQLYSQGLRAAPQPAQREPQRGARTCHGAEGGHVNTRFRRGGGTAPAGRGERPCRFAASPRPSETPPPCRDDSPPRDLDGLPIHRPIDPPTNQPADPSARKRNTEGVKGRGSEPGQVRPAPAEDDGRDQEGRQP
uniref:Uncharacterized protein n=1 Tax=Sphaerodactylus townsendi TaxID=933632 RepID=A0ACB8GER2_9SAUR